MTPIEWTPDLAISDEIDEQHQEIFRRVNELLAACKVGKGREQLLEILHFLGDYIMEHFAAEEAMQLAHGYPDYAAHKREHDAFKLRVRELQARVAKDGPMLDLLFETNREVVDWLVNHIRRCDSAIGAFLKGKA